MRKHYNPTATIRIVRSFVIAALAIVAFHMVATAAEIEDRYEQRFHEAGAAIHNNDTAKAFKIWLELAQQGHAESQFAVGSLYGEGLGTKADIKRTAHWWSQAAEQGHAGAQFNLGMLYDEGLGVRQNTGEAIRLWQSAAEQGHQDAMFQLGLSYQEGRGVPKDIRVAHTWFVTAVLKGGAAFKDEAEQAAAALNPKELAISTDEAAARAARCIEHESPVSTTR